MIEILGLLEQAGIENLKESGTKEIGGSCPAHLERMGKHDAHSSWSINRFTFLHHCFSCGYSGTLTGLLIDQTGSAPENLEEELAKHSFLSTMKKVSQLAEPAVEERRAPQPVVNDWALANHCRDVPQRLVDFRHLQRKAVDAYGIRWDPERKSWVLPIRTPSGSLLGAQYRQKGIELNLPEGLEKSLTLFGLNEMHKHNAGVGGHDNRVALVESPLDAVRLYGIGIPAVSSFGAWVSWRQCDLLAGFTTVVLALDNDKTGRESTVKVRDLLKRRGCATTVFDYTGLVDVEGRPAKDPGDVADDTALWNAWNRSL